MGGLTESVSIPDIAYERIPHIRAMSSARKGNATPFRLERISPETSLLATAEGTYTPLPDWVRGLLFSEIQLSFATHPFRECKSSRPRHRRILIPRSPSTAVRPQFADVRH